MWDLVWPWGDQRSLYEKYGKNLGIAIYRHKYIKLWYIEDRIGANQTWFIEIMGMALFDVQEVVLGHMTQKNYRRMGEGVSMAQIGVETWNF